MRYWGEGLSTYPYFERQSSVQEEQRNCLCSEAQVAVVIKERLAGDSADCS